MKRYVLRRILSGILTVLVELVAAAGAEGDLETRADLYKQAQAIMAAELPMVPIADWTNFIAYANIFKGFPVATVTDDGQAVGEYEMTYVDFV